jgi:hypothetical protein
MSVSAHETMEELKKRLFSADGRDRRLLVLDNLKTLRFSWDDLEALLTADVISGRAMFIGEGRRPNTLIVSLTLNGASMSKDMAQRVIPVHLRRPVYDPTWWERLSGFIGEHRWAIVGDLLAEFDRRPAKLASVSRWSSWEAEVLARMPEAATCQRVIAERQAEIDADEEELSLVREAFKRELRESGHSTESEIVFIPNPRVAEIIERATGEKRAPNRASAYLAAVGVPELRRSKRGPVKAWKWVGPDADPAAKMVEIGPRSFDPDPDQDRWER